MKISIALAAALFLLVGCASMAPPSERGLQIGSATSKNLFVDSSQFANRVVKLRLRNSSGDPSLDIVRLRSSIESGLRTAGYEISDHDFGIVIDVNAFQMQSVSTARIESSSGLGALLGAVAGYQVANSHNGISTSSGAILGAVAGATIEEVIRNHGEKATFIALCDVNIGVVRKEYKKKDSFVIGGNKVENKEESEPDTFNNFALRDTVRVATYAGDEPEKTTQTINALIDRLGRVVANLL